MKGIDVFDENLNEAFTAQLIVNLLTERELEALTFYARGLSAKAAAGKMGIDYRTVATHRHRICQKLGLRNATQVAILGWRIRKPLALAMRERAEAMKERLGKRFVNDVNNPVR